MKKLDKKTRFNLTYIFLALFGIVLIHDFWQQLSDVTPIPYSDFQRYLRENRIREVLVRENHIQGKFREPLEDGKHQFVTARVEPGLANDLAQYNITYSRVIESTLLRDFLSWVVPVLVFFGVWLFIMRRMGDKSGFGGGFMSVGKSKAKIFVETDIKTTFKDVAGIDEAKEEVKEIIDFLKDPQTYGRLGARMPKGVLLVGPPGTGKTLLAKAIAGEAGVPFFSISGSEFVEMFVGVGAARVRDLFEQAREKAPCIIFIDELDALGRARSAHPLGGGHDEKEQTLNQLLVELDGFDSRSGTVLLGATNRPEILDPALLRAGRFDRQILVDRPDRTSRIEILKVHCAKVKLAADVELEKLAQLTPGFTGADLANLVNEATLLATRRQSESVMPQDFNNAIERIVAGLEKKNRLLNPLERKVVAYHEMGHALVSCALPGSDTVHKVSIIPRGIGALGYTIQRPTEDRYLMTKDELENKMAVLLGGRAAEKLAFEHLSTGAADDLARVTDIARSIVMRYGMTKELGHVSYESEPANLLGVPTPAGFHERQFSEETAREIDCAVRELVDKAYARACDILSTNRLILEDGAKLLLEKETLVEKDLSHLFSKLVPLQSEGLASLASKEVQNY